MLKKISLAVFMAGMFCSAAPAQQAGTPKVLVIIASQARPRVMGALRRAIQLKKGGAEVRVIFEREGVILFIDPYKIAETPRFKKKLEDYAAADAKRGDSAKKTDPKYKLLSERDSDPNTGKGVLDMLAKLKQNNIPYQVCGTTAKRIYDIYDELVAAGVPVTTPTDEPIDISDYLKQGYQVLTD